MIEKRQIRRHWSTIIGKFLQKRLCTKYENSQDLFSVVDEFQIKKQSDSKSFMQVLAFMYRRLVDFCEAHLFESDCITNITFLGIFID